MPPKISVVVPMYNVAAYVETCLESLARQSVTDLEVIMVDDGSTDETLALATPFAERDPRFRLVTQPNGGLGQARNTGTDVATGDYIAFVDSDDVVPPHAYESLLAALESSGSDFASGNARRLASYGTSPAAFLSGIYQKTRLGTHVTKFPALINDRTAWNKLFRRSFWDKHSLRFPEGMLYEDMPVTVPAHFLARAVDVVDKTVYLWRVREGADLSITQQRTDLRAMRDRVRAVDLVSRFLAEHGFDDAKHSYDTNVLRDDLRYFLDVLPAAEDDFRDAFLDLANDYLDRADPEVATPLPALQRLKWHFVRRRALPPLLEVLYFQDEDADRTPPVRRGESWYGDYPFLDDASVGVPRDVYRVDDELAAASGLDDVSWSSGGGLVVVGWAYVEGIGAPARRSQQVRVIVESGDERIGIVDATEVYRPDVTATAKTPTSLDWSGFQVEVPAEMLPPTEVVPASVRLTFEVTAGGVVRATSRPSWGDAVPERTASRGKGRRAVRARLSSAGDLEVALVQDRAMVRSCRWERGVLQVEGELRSDEPDGARLQVARRVGTAEIDYPLFIDRSGDRPTFLARVPVADLLGETDVSDEAGHTEASGDGVAWDFALVAKSRRRITMPPDVMEQTWTAAGHELSLERSRYGYLSLVVRSPRPVIASARWTADGTLAVAGTFAVPDGDYALVLRRRRGSEEHVWPLRHVDGRFDVSGRVVGIADPLQPAAMAPGRWDLGLRAPDGTVVDAVLDHGLLDELPVMTTVGARTLRFGASGYDTPMLVVGRDLAIDESGEYHQRRHVSEQSSRRRRRLRDSVLYLCHGGYEFSDSPRAIYDELVRRGADLEHLWVVRDGRFTVPPPARAVRADSADYYEALRRARYVVSDDYWPADAEPRRGQRFIQTWHGPWVKAHGDDIADHRPAWRAHRRFVQQRPEQWATVLSPAPAFTPVVRRSFPFAGDVVETGLPRMDLVRDDDGDADQRIRDRVGLGDKKIVLYAPTYRDHLTQGRTRFRLGQTLDLDTLRGGLDEDTVVLFRRHRNVVGRLASVGDPLVRDVSDYPSPADLVRMADVLVTDYSEIVFDQVSAGRPVVFFTPDLESYRDRVRGFAIPFEDEAPGPLLRTTGEVVEALRDLDAVRADYEKRYDAFASSYCSLDDGRAAARAVDALFR